MSNLRIESSGVIRPDELYELSECQRRLGWGKAAFRTARRNGLKVRYCSRRAYVMGADLISYIDEHGKDEK